MEVRRRRKIHRLNLIMSLIVIATVIMLAVVGDRLFNAGGIFAEVTGSAVTAAQNLVSEDEAAKGTAGEGEDKERAGEEKDQETDSEGSSTDSKAAFDNQPPPPAEDLTGKKVAYLTFDDGPSENTELILNILDNYGIKATFFVIYHKGSDALYQRIAERGHTLALHSFSHDYQYIYSSPENYFQDLANLEQYLSQLTGKKPTIMRFPGGSSNLVSKKYSPGIMTTLTSQVEQKGYRYFDWNVDSTDAKSNDRTANEIAKETLKNTEGIEKAVILMHDAKAKRTTADALPKVIAGLLDQGYIFRPINDTTAPVHHRVQN